MNRYFQSYDPSKMNKIQYEQFPYKVLLDFDDKPHGDI